MKNQLATLFAAAALGLAPLAQADDAGGIGIEVKGGTLGVGAEINYAISPRFTIGAGINKYSASTTDTADNIDYDVDLDLSTVSLMLNFHPFKGSFRLTAGAMLNGNELNMTAKPNGATYDIGGNTYDSNDLGKLVGSVDFKNIAPYAGIGWGKSASSGFGFTMDIGVLFQGSPSVDFSTKNTDYAALAATAGIPQAQLEAQLKADLIEEEANAEKDIEGFDMYPVISLGVNYRF